jgi:sugar lactone lactonase YvrE
MRLLTAAVLALVIASCALGQTYTINTFAGGALPVNVPGMSASLRLPASAAVDGGGNLFFADYGYNVVLRLDATTGVLTLAAGNGTPGFSGDNGPATSAQLFTPWGVAVDSAGNLYIADNVNQRVREVSNGVITTVAGGGSSFADNVPATSAQLGRVVGVAVDVSGNLYIDDSTSRIRKVSNGVITTVAGNGTSGFSGDNGPATSAQFSYSWGIAVDTVGNLYIADTGNNRVREVSNGVITTVAGNGTSGYNGDNIAATSAELSMPYAVAVDAAGNLYVDDLGNVRIRKVSNGIITTLAGNGTGGFSGDNGPATSAQLWNCYGLAVSAVGSVYLADSSNNRLRKVSGGVITTVAGSGTVGDNAPATSAELYNPWGVAVDSAGSLYIGDSGNRRVRKVSNGVIATVAGDGTAGQAGAFSGDNGPATSAQVGVVIPGVAVDSAGNLYIADSVNQRIRKVSNGVITTVAGGGSSLADDIPATSALLSPGGIAVDAAGNLYIADGGSSRIRKVSNGVITTVAGNGTSGFSGDSGPATSAELNGPEGVAVDTAGNLYIADGNYRIREVSNGVIATVAGNGTPGFSGDNGPATSAELYYAWGVAVDSVGSLYIADASNNRIRRVSNGVITTVAGGGTTGYPGDNGPATSAELYSPYGVALDSAGNLYVSEYYGDRVRVMTPYGAPCSASVAPLSVFPSASGGSFTIAIQTSSSSCPWAIQGLPSWIAFSGNAVRTGPGSVTLTVAPNSGGPIKATISIAGASVQVYQAGAASCTYALSPGGQAFLAAGGSGSVNVITTSGCSWAASSALSWVGFTGSAFGTGSGTVTYQVAANTGGTRSGNLTIAGLPFTVEQASSTFTAAPAGSISQVVSGGTWNTTITLVNTGSTPAEVFLNFFGDAGAALQLPLTFPQTSTTTQILASTLDETIAAGAELVIQTAGTASQATQEGWVQLLSNGSISGSAIFGFATAGGEQEAVAPVVTVNPSAFLLSFDNTGGTSTGIALANVTNQAVSVPVILRDGTGTSLGSVAAISLPAYGHTSFLLGTQYPATAGILGTLVLDTPAGAQISPLGIRAIASGAITSISLIAK